MKGKFTYDNKTFRWRFQIKYQCTEFCYNNAHSIIFYKNNPFQIISDCMYCDTKGNYHILLERYNNKSDEEINKIVEDKIIKDYELLKVKKRFE